MKNNNNRYDDEFKSNAIKMVVEKGQTISEVAKDLELSELTLRRWVKATSEKHEFIKIHSSGHSVEKICKLLEVSI